MTRTILGLDVGGANLKAATPDGRAVSLPFALWKQPDRLPAALAELVGRFPGVGELAVTMTGELCDCYETKRQGVNAILDAVEFAAAGRPVRVWGTGGEFLTVGESRAEYMAVAAANWHALATFVGRYEPASDAVLVDVGSTTTDIVPLRAGRPMCQALTDMDRMNGWELIYSGVRRTPVCAVASARIAAELFATTLDVYLMLGMIAPDEDDCDTADGRPATTRHAHARLSRMLGGDLDLIEPSQTRLLAERVAAHQAELIAEHMDSAVFGSPAGFVGPVTAFVAGSGEFLARLGLARMTADAFSRVVSLTETLGPAVSACAPAYAVAVLASERPL